MPKRFTHPVRIRQWICDTRGALDIHVVAKLNPETQKLFNVMKDDIYTRKEFGMVRIIYNMLQRMLV